MVWNINRRIFEVRPTNFCGWTSFLCFKPSVSAEENDFTSLVLCYNLWFNSDRNLTEHSESGWDLCGNDSDRAIAAGSVSEFVTSIKGLYRVGGAWNHARIANGNVSDSKRIVFTCHNGDPPDPDDRLDPADHSVVRNLLTAGDAIQQPKDLEGKRVVVMQGTVMQDFWSTRMHRLVAC